MIKLVKIHKIYQTKDMGFLALKDINLDFTDDRFVCVLGKSGCGKTTLLNIMGGLDKASSGHMVIDGVLTTKFTQEQWDYFRNYEIGFVFQNYSLVEHLNVVDNVMLALKIQGTKKKEALEKALQMLDKVSILDQAYKMPSQLSGGQRQRVAIARALINNPRLILADEPTGSLDKKTSREILELIKEISADTLVIMVTHNRKIANTYADRIIEMRDGEVISDSKPRIIEKVNIKKVKPKKIKFSLGEKIKHSIKNIRMKKWRSFLLAFGLAIGVAGLLVIDGISNGLKVNYAKSKDAYNASPDMNISIFFDDDNEDKVTEAYDLLIEDRLVEGVRIDKKISLRAVKLNESDLSSYTYGPVSYKFTSDKSNQLRLFGSVYEDGRWPENDNEIVITKEYAQQFYNLDNIDSLWNKLEGAKIEIVDEYYYYIDNNYLQYYQGEITERYLFIDETTEPEGYDVEEFGSFEDQLNTQRELFNKILTDDQGYIYFCSDYTLLNLYQSNEVKSTKELTVVGINEATHINYSIISKDAYMNLKSYGPYKEGIDLNVYLTEEGKKDLIDLKIKYRDLGYISSNSDYVGISDDMVFNIMVNMIQFAISALMFISVITAGIMVLIVLYISITERSREIGILRSLGATRNDVLFLFISECGVIGFMAGIMGIVISIIATLIGNELIVNKFEEEILATFNDLSINFIIMRPIIAVVGIILSILLAMFFGLLPAIAASKKTPIDALKTR